MNSLRQCLKCIETTEKELNEVITKCDEDFKELSDSIEQLKLSPPKLVRQIAAVSEETSAYLGCSMPDRAAAVASATQEVASATKPLINDEAYYSGKGKLYYAVLSFPINKQYRLKVKNKMKITKLENFTFQQQLVLFKREINNWREICSGNFVIIPEHNKSTPCYHYNIIFRAESSQTIHDMTIAFVDAYGIDYKFKKHFVNIKEVVDLKRLTDVYLKKTEGKEYQYTGIMLEISNII